MAAEVKCCVSRGPPNFSWQLATCFECSCRLCHVVSCPAVSSLREILLPPPHSFFSLSASDRLTLEAAHFCTITLLQIQFVAIRYKNFYIILLAESNLSGQAEEPQMFWLGNVRLASREKCTRQEKMEDTKCLRLQFKKYSL